MKAPAHLNALKAFEASARHRSFAAAAAELNVTPAAVGQLVKSLEAAVGTPLFVRSSGGPARLVATDAALSALPDIRAGLDRLSAALQRLREHAATNVLTVTVSPAFAAKWLLPRFDRFQANSPEIDVRLETHLKPVDFVAQRIDIGVRYGAGTWPGLQSEKLMDEEVFPVASPSLLQGRPRLSKPAELKSLTLLHDLSMRGDDGFPTWEKWLLRAGVAAKKTAPRGMQINNSAAVLQAAIEGQGVALARSVMAHDDLAAGRLVRLFPRISVASELAYYVVCRPECASRPDVRAFRDWLFSEAAVLPRTHGTRR